MSKKYEPCEICGYGHYTEKHHPDGKVEKLQMAECELFGKTLIHTTGNNPDKYIFYTGVDGKEPIALTEKKSELEKQNPDKIYGVMATMVHKYPEDYIVLCGNCHALVHRKGLSIDEIKKIHETDDALFFQLFRIMEFRVGKLDMDEIKIGLIKSEKRNVFLKTFIGKECKYCKKKHYKTSTVFNCYTYEESNLLFIKYMETVIADTPKTRKDEK